MPQRLCKACGRPKPLLAVEQEDEFCSTACARRYHGMGQAERTDHHAAPAAAPRSIVRRAFGRPFVPSPRSKHERN